MNGMINPAPMEVSSIGRISLPSMTGCSCANFRGAKAERCESSSFGVRNKTRGMIPTISRMAVTARAPAYALLSVGETANLVAIQVGR